MRHIVIIGFIALLLISCSSPVAPIVTPGNTSEAPKPSSTMTLGNTPAPTRTTIPTTAPSYASTPAATATRKPTLKPTVVRSAPNVAIVPTKAPLRPPTSTGTSVAIAPRGNCDPSYPDFCIPPPPPDLDCKDVKPHKKFRVLPPDPHGFDRDGDGIGCEN